MISILKNFLNKEIIMGSRKTYRGKLIDMDALQKQNEKSTAMGNMGVNAKGDKLGPNGKVIESADSRSRKHYNTTRKTVRTGSLKSKPSQEENNVFDENEKSSSDKPAPKQSTKKPSKSKKEVEKDNGDIVIEDGDSKEDENDSKES